MALRCGTPVRVQGLECQSRVRDYPDWRNLQRMTETEVSKWMCESCGFIYDPDEGDPDGGIPPGTPFAAIPDTWFCPVCGARKSEFVPYED